MNSKRILVSGLDLLIDAMDRAQHRRLGQQGELFLDQTCKRHLQSDVLGVVGRGFPIRSVRSD